MTATAEEVVEVDDVETNMDVVMDATVPAEKNVMPMEASIDGPTVTARIPGQTARRELTDTMQTRFFLTTKEAESIIVLDGVG